MREPYTVERDGSRWVVMKGDRLANPRPFATLAEAVAWAKPLNGGKPPVVRR